MDCAGNLEYTVSKGTTLDGRFISGYFLAMSRYGLSGSCSANYSPVRFGIHFGGTDAANPSVWHQLNQWYYVSGSYDGSYIRFYVNGILEATSAYVPNLTVTNTEPLYINRHTFNGGSSQGRMQGIIDEVRISNVARSQQEISNYYNQAVPSLNQPPTISNLGQFKSDGLNQIIENTITTDSAVIFKAILNDPNNDQAKLQIELKEKEQNFNEQNLLESDFVNSGSEAIIIKVGLIDGQYHWRVRAVDDKGNVSQWQEFGTAGNVDFIVLCQMINPTVVGRVYKPFPSYPGHEGIDILNGDEIFGSSVKTVASGEIVRIDNIDDSRAGKWLWIYHGDIIKLSDTVVSNISTRYLHLDTIQQLLEENQIISQGNVIGTIGKTGTSVPHLHLEVRQGDIPANKNYKLTQPLNPHEFVDYPIPPQALSIMGLSPIDLIVIDPDGLVISKDTNELTGLARYYDIKYFGSDEGENVSGYDIVVIDERKVGDYFITVIPEVGALPTDTYSLTVTSAGITTSLVENITITEISIIPYIIRSTEAIIEKIIPAAITIKPETLNIDSKGVFTAFVEIPKGFGVGIQDINSDTIILEGAAAIKTQLANDKKLVVHFRTQDLVNIIPEDAVKLTLKGKLFDNTIFEGSDIIRIIKKEKP